MAGHIPWRKVDLWLQAHRAIWLATTRPDGRPHAAPVWYVWDGAGAAKQLYFLTGRGTQKARNLAHEHWVVAHLLNGDDTLILIAWPWPEKNRHPLNHRLVFHQTGAFVRQRGCIPQHLLNALIRSE